jgi:hypothetical protein
LLLFLEIANAPKAMKNKCNILNKKGSLIHEMKESENKLDASI